MTRIVIGLFSATALLLGGGFVVLLVSVVNLRHDDTRARKPSDVLLQAVAVERSVVDLETGLRGFLLTGQARFLQTYEHARERLPAQLGNMRHLAGSGQERARVGELSAGISRYIEDYATPVPRTGAGLSAAQKVAVTSRGKQLVDSLRSNLDALEAGQLAARQRSRVGANSGGSLALVAAAVGLEISLALLLGQRIYLLLRILRPIRVAAAATERVARGDLSVRVPTVGVGEVALLGKSFNAMADAIQTDKAELSRAYDKLEQAVREARDASAMKSNFLANMCHEIRTPLNGVIGMMNLLADTSLTGEQREYVDAARSSGDVL